MNTQLQQLIEEMKDDLSKASTFYEEKRGNVRYKSEWLYHGGRADAFEKYIPKLQKILNEGSVAASECVDFSKDYLDGNSQISGC